MGVHHMICVGTRLGTAVLAGLLCCLLPGCVVPDVDRSIAKSSAAAPQIEGTAGPLNATQSRILLARIDGSARSDVLHRHLAIEEAVAGSPLTTGNKVTVLRDGPGTFRAIATAIRDARQTLNLEYYRIEDVVLPSADGGSIALSDLLLARRRDGIAINIIYDSYGSSDTPPDFFTKLAAAGVNLLPYHPVSPTTVLEINDRDHRKILVADGELGIVGGVNLSKSYESKAPGGDDDEEEDEVANPVPAIGDALGLTHELPSEWRDTAMQIEGPAVAELQTLFRDHWLAEKGPPLDETGFFPKPMPKGSEVARIIGSSPDEEIPRYYVTLVSALRNAEEKAWISAAYFVPTPEQAEALIDAARRGVDVRLLLAEDSDSPQAVEAAQTHYSALLDAGVRIYETTGVVMHAKTVVIDGVWSAVGSSNFDHRSVLFNDEVDAIVLGPDTASALETVFEEGMQIATEIDPATWEDTRSLPDRVKGGIARLLEPLL